VFWKEKKIQHIRIVNCLNKRMWPDFKATLMKKRKKPGVLNLTEIERHERKYQMREPGTPCIYV